VINDVGVLEPDPQSCELPSSALHPSVEVADVRAETQWDLGVSDDLERTEPPTDEKLSALRKLVGR
jgi:glutaconate CoA-transferase subunit B